MDYAHGASSLEESGRSQLERIANFGDNSLTVNVFQKRLCASEGPHVGVYSVTVRRIRFLPDQAL